MADLTDAAVSAALAARGVPRHIVEGGADGLISRWREFIAQVGAGYALGLDDYRNDLDIRTLIELTGLGPRVVEEDARLRALLIAERTEIWSSDAPEAWWTHGYPGNAGLALRKDLLAEGKL